MERTQFPLKIWRRECFHFSIGHGRAHVDSRLTDQASLSSLHFPPACHFAAASILYRSSSSCPATSGLNSLLSSRYNLSQTSSPSSLLGYSAHRCNISSTFYFFPLSSLVPPIFLAKNRVEGDELTWVHTKISSILYCYK